jgi:malate/lactate dehydrogenase
VLQFRPYVPFPQAEISYISVPIIYILKITKNRTKDKKKQKKTQRNWQHMVKKTKKNITQHREIGNIWYRRRRKT